MTNNSSNYTSQSLFYDILYAAFLHDMGKFFWRSDRSPIKRYEHLTDDDYGRSGAHSKWSAEFFLTELKDKLVENVDYNLVENLILFHHNPDSDKINVNNVRKEEFKKLATIIQIADHASSGERIKRADGEELGSPRTEILHSVFSNVKLKKPFSKSGFYSIRPLLLGEESRDVLFPKLSKEEAYGKYASDTQPLYRELFNSFKSELNSLVQYNKKITFQTLFNLILKYTINIPSATYVDIPDISLFHHMKSTAAIAICLFMDLMQENNDSLERIELLSIKNAEKARYLLLEGNISGIQNFIYSISSKGAAKGLKGRSFFVQYLGELISETILRQLNLPRCCEIYCDGGNFYSLVPASIENSLKDISFTIKKKIYDIFKGILYIDIDWVKCNLYNFSIVPSRGYSSFGETWAEINSLLGKKKFQRYNDVLSNSKGYQKVFLPQGSGGEREGICSICKLEKKKLSSEKKCRLCENFEKITSDLIDTNYLLILKYKDIEETEYGIELNDIKDFSRIFGSEIRLIRDDNDFNASFNEIEEKSSAYDRIDIYIINGTGIESVAKMISSFNMEDIEINIGFKFFGNLIPVNKKEVKNFDMIAENGTGDRKIGILRMDVDNLGSIFSQGLEINSLSRLSSLSFRLMIFFKYWINQICSGNIEERDLNDLSFIQEIEDSSINDYLERLKSSIKNNIYLIYSSGDDLFLIGHWNDIILLSTIIREVFTTYTLSNPNITISAGVSIVNPKFPLYQAAKVAGVAEEAAKSTGDKNSVNVLGQVYSWKKFKELCLFKDELYLHLFRNELDKAIIHKLLQFNREYQEVREKALNDLKNKDQAFILNRDKINLYYANADDDLEQIACEAAYYSPWHWHFRYFIKQIKGRKEVMDDFLNRLEENVVAQNKKMIQDLYLPVRWVELLLKEKKTNKNSIKLA